MHDLKELIEQLPPELQQEVQDFVEFLLERKVKELEKETVEKSQAGGKSWLMKFAGAIKGGKDIDAVEDKKRIYE